MNKYERKKVYRIDETLSNLKISQSRFVKFADFDGDLIKPYSLRYKTFAKSTVCARCGLKASFFAKERIEKDGRYHLNLYGVKDGVEILFTRDHIIPKSRGGSESLENMQTMCCVCNNEKGNLTEDELLESHLETVFNYILEGFT